MRKIGLFCLVLFLTWFIVGTVAMAETQRGFHGMDILQSVASTSDINRAEVITAQEVCFLVFNDTAAVICSNMTPNGALSAMAEILTAKGDRSPVFYYASMAISPSLTINGLTCS